VSKKEKDLKVFAWKGYIIKYLTIHTQHPFWGDVTHITIARKDQMPIRNWQDLQRIKEKICGEDSTGIEIFPKKSNLVDNGNIYHLWVTKAELPFGLHNYEDLKFSL
jgi:uncharacterized protein YegJ (DUF2314 family)